jgi:L-alanine-DL-glutamate epimerase-like enolase superfamily enzyme
VPTRACTTASLAALKGKYDAVNIKLDKAGGLTEALALAEAAASMGFEIMVGSMVSTSLGVAPALLLAGAPASSISTGRSCWPPTGPRASASSRA